MVANIRGYTPNYQFKLINFDVPRWHTLEYDNWNMLDSMFALLGTAPIRGEWTNSTHYVPGERVFDAQSGELYRCLLVHDSAPTGTFAADRIARPTLWALQLGGVPVYRGAWQPSTFFAMGDIVVVGTYDYYLCTTAHTSTASFPGNGAHWQMVFSASQVMIDADAAADAAAGSATDAANSAAAADISEANAAASADSASASADSAQDSAVTASNTQGAFRWLFEAQNVSPPGVGAIRVNNATPSSITAVFIHAQTADVGNPDVSSWVITWDDSTNLQSKGTVYVRNAVDPENFFIFNITGAAVIVDNGTWLSVPVVYVTHSGSFAAQTVLSVAFTRAGNDGTSGTGSGDMLRSANLSDVLSVPTSRNNLGLGTAQVPTFNQVTVAIDPTVDMHVATKKYVDDLPDPPPPLIVQGTAPSVAATLDNAMWWDNDNGVLYVLYNDGDSRQWVQAVALPVVDTQGFVQKTGDTMSGHLALPTSPAAANAVRRDYVDTYAAPLDALAYNGMQINGSMEVSQERGFDNAVTLPNYACDGWIPLSAGTMAFACAPSVTSITSGFPNMLYIAITTAQPSLGVNDYLGINQSIEGYRVSRLAWGSAEANPITICFWCKHNRAGLYSGSIRNGVTNRSYVFTYTQSVANTLQYNTVTIPGDTSGAWTATNTAGMHVFFTMGCGTAPTAPSANTWLAGNYRAAPGQVNAVAATSDVFRITGICILPGITAPTAAQSPLIMRPYDQELLTCQRHYYKIEAPEQLPCYQRHPGDFARISSSLHPTPMRSSPAMAVGAQINFSGGNVPSTAASGYPYSWSAEWNRGNTTDIVVVKSLIADARL